MFPHGVVLDSPACPHVTHQPHLQMLGRALATWMPFLGAGLWLAGLPFPGLNPCAQEAESPRQTSLVVTPLYPKDRGEGRTCVRLTLPFGAPFAGHQCFHSLFPVVSEELTICFLTLLVP